MSTPYRLVMLRGDCGRIYGAQGEIAATVTMGRDTAELILAALNADAAGLPPHVAAAPLKAIRTITAKQFGVSEAELVGAAQGGNSLALHPVVQARDLAILLTREFTGISMKRIGRHFGDRDHTTISTAIGRARSRLAREADYRIADGRIRAELYGEEKQNV